MATSESAEMPKNKQKNEPLFPTKNPSVDTHTSSGSSKKTVVLVVIVAVSNAS